MDHFHLKDGQLCAEQVELRAIAEEIGTPVYVYSSATLRHHAAVMKQALASLDDPLIAYAVKANPNSAVLATLAQEGLGGDIVSIGEYRQAIAAGMAPDRIVFSGVGKTADEMAEALARADIAAPRAPVVANVTARPAHDPDELRRLLVEQVTGRVRWRESVAWLAEGGGVSRFAEAGAGKVLSGMVKRIVPDAEATPLNAPADLEAFAKSL